MRIVVAPDKFKGTLTAAEAARAVAQGIRRIRPDAAVDLVLLGDGGEGSLQALVAGRGGRVRDVTTTDPIGRAISAPVMSLPDGSIFFESAAASGLTLLDSPDPLRATSRGTGEMLLSALHVDAPSTVIVGVGGTASTDGGTGAAAAAGWRFLDARGRELPPGGGALVDLGVIDSSRVTRAPWKARVVAACDVTTPMTGSRGAARVFAPQKGASSEDVAILEAGLDRLAEIMRRDLSLDLASSPHGGAGGGLGAGLAAFFGAELVSGFHFIAAAIGLEQRVRDADVVITGEGALDASTGEGKVVSGVIRLARSHAVDCAVVAGEIVDSPVGLGDDPALRTVSLVERFGRRRALDEAAECLAVATAELFDS